MKVSDLMRKLKRVSSEAEVSIPQRVFYEDGKPCYLDEIGVQQVVVSNNNDNVLIIPSYDQGY